MRMTKCQIHQAILYQFLQKKSLKLLRLFIKINPIVINIWIILVALGVVFRFDLSFITGLRYDLGNSTIHCFIYLLGSYVFKLCKWHRILVATMFVYPILHKIQNAGYLLNQMEYIFFSNCFT